MTPYDWQNLAKTCLTPGQYLDWKAYYTELANDTCFYAQCWNATAFLLAVVLRVPEYLPVPVKDSSELVLYRAKRDFGITAAIVAAVAASAAAAAAAAVALTTTVQTAATLNDLSANTAKALSTQSQVNAHLKGGIMLLNQRVDLIQEQVDNLLKMQLLNCQRNLPGICVTPYEFNNISYAANLSRQISKHLTGNWSVELDRLLGELHKEIVLINATRVDPAVAAALASWIRQAASHLKEWAGVGVLGMLLVALSCLCLWCMCRLWRKRQQDSVRIVQAMAAIEAGQSPQIWLAALGK
ncbi:Retroviral envelope protein containing protein-like protein [Leptotrombidium deliense]|uniref:Retroviral envelope protein containing protein-like protein n=1 Tax=Leptotrombidium deliense TaxID=299467 RepID=A0A443S419_9ACAR|nr:Retroviral envelope protein containing protein-like protein [Leptotrombidium deliense]